MGELVTGDAVILGLRPAKLPSRTVAVLVDLTIIWSVYLVVSLALLTVTTSLGDAAFAAVQVSLLLLVLIGGPIAVETLSQGRSVGKLMCGLRVVREDGGPIRFRHALVRGAMAFVEIQLTLGVVATLASLVSARGRRLGDVFAGTLVVRERVPAARLVPVPPPPPWLAGRFSTVDLSRVPEGLWLAVRQYLLRTRQLDQQVSWSMAQRLATDVAACTGTPPPADVPAAAYLAAVMAERQARDARRAFATAQAFPPAGAAASSAAPAPPVSTAPRRNAPSPAAQAAAADGTEEQRPEPVDGGAPATGFAPPG